MRIAQEIIHIDGTDEYGNDESSSLHFNKSMHEELILVRIVHTENNHPDTIHVSLDDLKKAIDKLAL